MADPSIIAEFVSISGTDEELAKYYLMESDNVIDRALNMYYANQSTQEEEIVILDDVNLGASIPPATSREAHGPDSDRTTCLDEDEESDLGKESISGPSCSGAELLDSLKLISWNIQGLDEKMLQERTTAVIHILKRESPDVVFLQEVVPPTLRMVQESFGPAGYHVFPGGRFAYFTALLLKKKEFTLETVMVEPFQNSNMLRNLIVAKVKFHGISLQLMTSHLESMANQSEERKSQMKGVFARMAGSRAISIFGGDTNSRDSEISELRGEMVNIDDIWELLGSPPESCFTWDMSQNDNLQFRGRTPRLRYDRIFVHQRTERIFPATFELVGKERLACGMFPSDHWGISATFRVDRSNLHAASGT